MAEQYVLKEMISMSVAKKHRDSMTSPSLPLANSKTDPKPSKQEKKAIPMPVMASLNLSLIDSANLMDNQEGEEDEEEKQLMNMLVRLKDTKMKIESSKKRKFIQRTISEAEEAFRQDVAQCQQSYLKNCEESSRNVKVKLVKVKQDIESKQKEMADTLTLMNAKIQDYESRMRKVVDDLRSYDKLITTVRSEVVSDTNAETDIAWELMSHKIDELSHVLRKMRSEANKDDRLTTIIKSLISTM